MAIVGFQFTKMRVERTGSAKGKIGVKHNVGIKNVEQAEFSLGKSGQEAVKFQFTFSIVYDPQIGEVLLEGEVTDILAQKDAKNVVEMWKKQKQLEPNLMAELLNVIYTKCNIQALILTKDLNLPAPIRIPRINVKVNPPPKTPAMAK